MKAKLKLSDYECRFKWPEKSKLYITEGFEKFIDILIEEAIDAGDPKKIPPETFRFTACILVPKSITKRKIYVQGKGYTRSYFHVVGCGNSFVEAEFNAFKNYNEVKSCQHDWINDHMSDNEKSIILTGDSHCSKCHMGISMLKMEDAIFEARNLSALKFAGLKYFDPELQMNHFDFLNQIFNRYIWAEKISDMKIAINISSAIFLYDMFNFLKEDNLKDEILLITNKEILDLAILLDSSKDSDLIFLEKLPYEAILIKHLWFERKLKCLMNSCKNKKTREDLIDSINFFQKNTKNIPSNYLNDHFNSELRSFKKITSAII